MIRITSLSEIIKKLSVKDEVKAIIKAFQLVFYLVLYIHMKACIWFYITRIFGKKWLPPIYWKYPVSVAADTTEFYLEENYLNQYIVSVYYSVLMLKPNEIGPRTDIDTLVCTLWLIIDLIVSAQIYGSVAVLVQMSGRRAASFQQDVDFANTAMKDLGIPGKVQTQVREFLINIAPTKEQQDELTKFFTMISPSLKQKVAISIFSQIFKSNLRLKSIVAHKMQEMIDHQPGLAKKFSQSKALKSTVKTAIISSIVSQLSTKLQVPEDVIMH